MACARAGKSVGLLCSGGPSGELVRNSKERVKGELSDPTGPLTFRLLPPQATAQLRPGEPFPLQMTHAWAHLAGPWGSPGRGGPTR